MTRMRQTAVAEHRIAQIQNYTALGGSVLGNIMDI